ncbi:hypothetical protein NE237_005941 [Protea cynaroides]|uniref:F-box domain-containing protein n=1 Tax=Protea cynaroides TaxID=273540 RepID=A0A9Q0KLK4_9MAGN|nr:hypothetical protein NE237_005941 [Protea cynaroides]
MGEPEGGSTSRTSSSRSIVSNNDDLMVNILSRLPVKALLRFKCVSSQWNILISDPYFVWAHLRQAPQDPNIMKLLWVTSDGLIRGFSVEDKEERKVTLDLIRPKYPDGFLQNCNRVIMAGRPCNGMICLTNGRIILVCNPATRDTLVIPRSNEREYNYLEGLGFCSSRNEFKVVSLYERSEGFGCELFTIGQRAIVGTHPLQPSRSWKHIGDFPYHISYPSDRNMCHVNSRVHWIIEPLTDSFYEYILCLDLELEEFKVVSCPSHWSLEVRYAKGVNLIDLGGELCVVFHNRDAWDIWTLKDYTNSIWSKEYQIDGNIKQYSSFDDFKVVGIWRRRLLLIVNNLTFCYYDPRNNTFEVILEKHFGHLSWRVATYVENLVIPF